MLGIRGLSSRLRLVVAGVVDSYGSIAVFLVAAVKEVGTACLFIDHGGNE